VEPEEAFLGRKLGFSIVRRKRYITPANVPLRRSKLLHVMLVGCDPGDTLKIAFLKETLDALKVEAVLKLYELGEAVPGSSTVRKSFETHNADLKKTGERIDIVHFVGALAGGAKDTQVVIDANSSKSGADVATLFAPESRPRLLLLHLHDAPERLAASAKSLVAVAKSASGKGIPNVMALPYRPGDEAGVAYVASLYRHLAEGQRMDASLRMAADSFEQDNSDAGECCTFPVLYCGEPTIFAHAVGADAPSRSPGGTAVGQVGPEGKRSSRSEPSVEQPGRRGTAAEQQTAWESRGTK